MAHALLLYGIRRESDVTRNAVDALFVVVAVINVALAEHRRKMSTELTRTTAVSLNKLSWAKSAALQVRARVAREPLACVQRRC